MLIFVLFVSVPFYRVVFRFVLCVALCVARRFGPDEALRGGLVNAVLDSHDLLLAVRFESRVLWLCDCV